jgi:hypothetical protein
MRPDDVHRLLEHLATDADTHHPADRVAAVHRRARRAAAMRTGAAAAVVAVVVAAGATGARGFLDARETTPSDRSPSGPYLRAELTEDPALSAALPPSPFGGTRVAVSISVRGRVPRLVAPAGVPAPEGRDNLLLQQIDWGDRGGPHLWQGNQGDDELQCGDGMPLVDVRDDYVLDHAYQRPGTYTVTFRTAACPPLAEVRDTITVTVNP